MTESCGVELGPLPLLDLGLGEGTKLRLVSSLKLGGWALLAPPPFASHCLRHYDAGQFGAGRRHPRRTQTADAVQLGRVPAELPRLGRRGGHRHLGQPEGVRRIRARTPARAAPPSCWIPAVARSMTPSRSVGAGAISGLLTTVGTSVGSSARRARQRRAGSLLRVDVRVPAAVRQDALRA